MVYTIYTTYKLVIWGMVYDIVLPTLNPSSQSLIEVPVTFLDFHPCPVQAQLVESVIQDTKRNHICWDF